MNRIQKIVSRHKDWRKRIENDLRNYHAVEMIKLNVKLEMLRGE